MGQQVVVDDGVDPVVDFARVTCPVRYQYLRLVADNAARAAEGGGGNNLIFFQEVFLKKILL
jgi:hypothetical protein